MNWLIFQGVNGPFLVNVLSKMMIVPGDKDGTSKLILDPPDVVEIHGSIEELQISLRAETTDSAFSKFYNPSST